MTTIEDLDHRFYAHHVDEHARFDRMVRHHLRDGDMVLDAGAGTGRAFSYDYAKARLVIGIDVDPAVGLNPNLSYAVVGRLERLPFRSGVFDLVMLKYVLEHLPDPLPPLLELRRALRSGGHVMVHTPNRFHYYAIVARVTPQWFHEWFNARRGVRESVHRTYYRANDRPTIRRLARRARLRVVRFEMFESKPAYLFFHPLAYLAGIAYERLVNRWDLLGDLRANIIGVLQAA